MASDNSYIALMTSPYAIILINSVDGTVIESYTHSTLSNPTNYKMDKFLIASPTQFFTGYTDENSYWRIV